MADSNSMQSNPDGFLKLFQDENLPSVTGDFIWNLDQDEFWTPFAESKSKMPLQYYDARHDLESFIAQERSLDENRIQVSSSSFTETELQQPSVAVDAASRDISNDDGDDDWSFATSEDAKFETFDDISMLTDTDNDFEDLEPYLDNSERAIRDTELIDFLVVLCS